ncbi:MAG: hypothetical protein LBR90_04925 [Elusimicrobiota bacterium]|jgi:hypothetical protein|nr:hypothetical protein [Elusimicrobiota bacterium]
MAVIKKPAAKKPAVKKLAVKKAAAKKSVVKKPAAPRASKLLVIDYPAAGEVVGAGHYTLRLGNSSQDAQWVKVSLNGGPWLPCRHSNGYWWLDYFFDGGPFEAQAVALVNGKEVKAAKRKFKVKH